MTKITENFKKTLHINKTNDVTVFDIKGNNTRDLFNSSLNSVLRDPDYSKNNLEINFVGYNDKYQDVFADDKYHQSFLQHAPAFVEQSQVSGRVTTILKLIKNEAIRRQEIMSASGLIIDDYNKHAKNKISDLLLIITDIDLLKKRLPHVDVLINEIISMTKNTNIILLTTSQSALASSDINANKNI